MARATKSVGGITNLNRSTVIPYLAARKKKRRMRKLTRKVVMDAVKEKVQRVKDVVVRHFTVGGISSGSDERLCSEGNGTYSSRWKRHRCSVYSIKVHIANPSKNVAAHMIHPNPSFARYIP